VDFSDFFPPGQGIKITSLLGTSTGLILLLPCVTVIMRIIVAGGDLCLNVDCKACGWGVVFFACLTFYLTLSGLS